MNEYISEKQYIIDYWKSKFNCLHYWQITYVYDGEHWCNMAYNTKTQKAFIYSCDICDENEYLLNQVIQLSMIVVNDDVEKKKDLVRDIVSLISEKGN